MTILVPLGVALISYFLTAGAVVYGMFYRCDPFEDGVFKSMGIGLVWGLGMLVIDVGIVYILADVLKVWS